MNKNGLVMMALLMAAAAPITASAAATESVIYSFQANGDGAYPLGNLLINAAGDLFTTTTYNSGAVIELLPPPKGSTIWTEQTLYTFTGNADGDLPLGDLASDGAGNFYGTTRYGGSSSGTNGFGTVYKLTAPAKGKTAWTETVLYSFKGPSGPGADGAYPTSNVVVGKGGVLYGNNYAGGSAGLGTVFELMPPKAAGGAWTEHVLHSMTGVPDGAVGYGGMVKDADGNLYGMTAGGGNGFGAVYKLEPPASGSTVWKESIMLKLNGAEGAYPQNRPILDTTGTLSGTAINGGLGCNPFNCGSVFRVNLKTGASVGLHSFTNTTGNGSHPSGALRVGAGDTLFGTTQEGGASGEGTVFELKPPAKGATAWSYVLLHSFTGSPNGGGTGDGTNPFGGLVADSKGALYGTAQQGGADGGGAIFKIVP